VPPTTSDNKPYWDKAAKGGDSDRFGSHSDPNITELENWFILSRAMKTRPQYLLDVGCGKGERTRYLSKNVSKLTLGLDYSEGMIALAKKYENERLKFQVANILEEPEVGFRPDLIVSCRCLINLQSEGNILKTLRFLSGLLSSGGELAILEASEQGHRKLNALRGVLGLDAIETAWYNINLDEKKVESQLERLHLRIVEKSRFGLYYLLTRAFYPASIRPRKPDPTSVINTVAKDLQIQEGSGTLEDFGRHYCAVFRKR